MHTMVIDEGAAKLKTHPDVNLYFLKMIEEG